MDFVIVLQPICRVLVPSIQSRPGEMCFFNFIFLFFGCFFFPQMENRFPSIFAAKKILVLHFTYDCTNQY